MCSTKDCFLLGAAKKTTQTKNKQAKTKNKKKMKQKQNRPPKPNPPSTLSNFWTRGPELPPPQLKLVPEVYKKKK